jgi:hypothetical protein
MSGSKPRAVQVLEELLDSESESVKLRAAEALIKYELHHADEPPPAAGVIDLPELPEGWDTA